MNPRNLSGLLELDDEEVVRRIEELKALAHRMWRDHRRVIPDPIIVEKLLNIRYDDEDENHPEQAGPSGLCVSNRPEQPGPSGRGVWNLPEQPRPSGYCVFNPLGQPGPSGLSAPNILEQPGPSGLCVSKRLEQSGPSGRGACNRPEQRGSVNRVVRPGQSLKSRMSDVRVSKPRFIPAILRSPTNRGQQVAKGLDQPGSSGMQISAKRPERAGHSGPPIRPVEQNMVQDVIDLSDDNDVIVESPPILVRADVHRTQNNEVVEGNKSDYCFALQLLPRYSAGRRRNPKRSARDKKFTHPDIIYEPEFDKLDITDEEYTPEEESSISEEKPQNLSVGVQQSARNAGVEIKIKFSNSNVRNNLKPKVEAAKKPKPARKVTPKKNNPPQRNAKRKRDGSKENHQPSSDECKTLINKNYQNLRKFVETARQMRKDNKQDDFAPLIINQIRLLSFINGKPLEVNVQNPSLE